MLQKLHSTTWCGYLWSFGYSSGTRVHIWIIGDFHVRSLIGNENKSLKPKIGTVSGRTVEIISGGGNLIIMILREAHQYLTSIPALPEGGRRTLVLIAGMNDILQSMNERHPHLSSADKYYFTPFVISRIEAIHDWILAYSQYLSLVLLVGVFQINKPIVEERRSSWN